MATATPAPHPAPALAGARDRIAAVALVAGALLLLASTVAFITEGAGINDGVLGGTIGVWSCLALIVGVVGLGRALEPRFPRGGRILALLGCLGFGSGVGFNIQAIASAHYSPPVDPLLSSVDGSDLVAVLAFLPWGWLAPVTLLVAGVLVWRAQLGPRWGGIALGAAGVLFVISRPERIDALAIGADVLLVAGAVAVASALAGPAGARAGAP